MDKIIEFIKNNIIFEIEENKPPYIKLTRHDYCELMRMLEKYSEEDNK